MLAGFAGLLYEFVCKKCGLNRKHLGQFRNLRETMNAGSPLLALSSLYYEDFVFDRNSDA